MYEEILVSSPLSLHQAEGSWYWPHLTGYIRISLIHRQCMNTVFYNVVHFVLFNFYSSRYSLWFFFLQICSEKNIMKDVIYIMACVSYRLSQRAQWHIQKYYPAFCPNGNTANKKFRATQVMRPLSYYTEL